MPNFKPNTINLSLAISLFLVSNSFAANTVTSCDTLAGGVYDPNKVAPGIFLGQINIAQAEPACKTALANDPNNPRLLFEYGRVFDAKKDYKNAFVYYTLAAQQNYAPAQSNIGDLYYLGYGVVKNFETSVFWYQKAADNNFAPAQNYLGSAYYYGEGVGVNFTKAFEWFQKSANQNYAIAQNFLGYLYETGDGVAKDLNKAFEWYQKSANGGEPLGNLNVGAFYHNGSIFAKNEAKAMAQWRIASNMGLVDASVELVFSWAEATFPTWLPGFATSLPPFLPAPYDKFLYRHYTSGGTDIYVAYNVDDKHVYYYGPNSGNQLLDLGTLNPFLQQALAYEKTLNPN